jgi:hypothetical protein
MHEAFVVHLLNDQGKAKAKRLAEGFDAVAMLIQEVGLKGREMSLAMTKLEEAFNFAKKAMAINLENQQQG